MPTLSVSDTLHALIEEIEKAELTEEEALQAVRREIDLRRRLRSREADRFAVATHPEDY